MVVADTARRIIEGPMFNFALAALHDEATDVFPASAVFEVVGVRKMEVRFGHAQIGTDAVEAEFAIGAFEGEGMFGADGFVVFNPFVHAPEVRGSEVEFEFVDEAGDEWELFGGADGAADAAGVIWSRSAPGGDVFEGFGEVEIFEGVVENDFETGARKLFDVFKGEFGDVGNE